MNARPKGHIAIKLWQKRTLQLRQKLVRTKAALLYSQIAGIWEWFERSLQPVHVAHRSYL